MYNKTQSPGRNTKNRNWIKWAQEKISQGNNSLALNYNYFERIFKFLLARPYMRKLFFLLVAWFDRTVHCPWRHSSEPIRCQPRLNNQAVLLSSYQPSRRSAMEGCQPPRSQGLLSGREEILVWAGHMSPNIWEIFKMCAWGWVGV